MFECCRHKVDLIIYIPKWKFIRNIAGIIRTASIFEYLCIIGPTEYYDYLIAKDKKLLNHCTMNLSNYIVSKNITNYTNTYKFVVFETLDFWNSNNIKPESIHDLKLESMILIFGDEAEGINLSEFENFVPCFIPQKLNGINSRRNKLRNNVSLNLNSAATAAIAILNTRIVKNPFCY